MDVHPEDVEMRRRIMRELMVHREILGLTQDEIGARIGTHRSNISKLEYCSDRRDMYIGTLFRHARALGYRLVLDLELLPDE